MDEIELLIKLGPGRALLEEVLLRKVAAELARRRGIDVSDEQVDEALAEMYGGLELFEPPQEQAWLATVKVEEASLREFLRERLLKDELRPLLAPDEAVRQRFSASPYDFAELHVQKIAVEGQGAAAELTLELKESEITWEQAAGVAGGMACEVLRRQDAPPEAAAALYAAELGDFVGPVEDAMDTYVIYRVAWKDEPELTDELREEIRGQLFDEALRAAVALQPMAFLR